MNLSIPKTLLRSLIISYILSGIMILILAFVLYKLKLRETQMNAVILIVYGAVCLAGGYTAGRRIGSRRFFWGLLTGFLYFAVLLAVSFFLSHGETPDTAKMLPVFGSCVIGGTLGGMMS
ncbi:MAG: TIGR04086 family membrane protein [Clostridiales bacterium]|nr:TIGR04086 family membrane protein [Clostridiales bacterium]